VAEEQIENKRNNPEKIKGGKSKYYDTPIGKVQGTFEKLYIDNLLINNKTLPNIPKGIRTDNGLYFPDFEFQDRYIEIKSPFTYEIFEGKIAGFDKTTSTKQKEKLLWVSKNIKPVELIILDKRGEILNSIYFD